MMKFVPLVATTAAVFALCSPAGVDGFQLQPQIGVRGVSRGQQQQGHHVQHNQLLFASVVTAVDEETKTVAVVDTPGKKATTKPKNNNKNNHYKGKKKANGRTNKPPTNNKNKNTNRKKNNNGSSGHNGESRRDYNKRRYLMKRWKSQQEDQKRKQQKELVSQKKKEGKYTELVSAIGYQPSKQNKQNNKKKNSNNKTAAKQKTLQKKTDKKSTNTKPKLELTPWSTLEPGSTVSGKVIKMLPYGALVQIPYDIPGKTPGCVLLHQNQIPKNNKTGKPAFTIKAGQPIQNARVLTVNRDKGSVNISLLKSDPSASTKRATPVGNLQVGDEVLGKVVRLKQYGAFVDIGLKRNALLHLSRMSMYKVTKITDHVNVGEFIKVRVLKMGDASSNGGELAVSMLSRDNDAFVDRRDLQRKRMAIWDTVVSAHGEQQLQNAKKELIEIDRKIWEDFMESAKEGMRRTGEV